MIKKFLISITRKEAWIRSKNLIHIAYFLLNFRVEKSGIWFWRNGDIILWLWPWRQAKHKYVSLMLSGTGEFGDAGFNSLKEIDRVWEEYNTMISALANEPFRFP